MFNVVKSDTVQMIPSCARHKHQKTAVACALVNVPIKWTLSYRLYAPQPSFSSPDIQRESKSVRPTHKFLCQKLRDQFRNLNISRTEVGDSCLMD